MTDPSFELDDTRLSSALQLFRDQLSNSQSLPSSIQSLLSTGTELLSQLKDQLNDHRDRQSKLRLELSQTTAQLEDCRELLSEHRQREEDSGEAYYKLERKFSEMEKAHAADEHRKLEAAREETKLNYAKQVEARLKDKDDELHRLREENRHLVKQVKEDTDTIANFKQVIIKLRKQVEALEAIIGRQSANIKELNAAILQRDQIIAEFQSSKESAETLSSRHSLQEDFRQIQKKPSEILPNLGSLQQQLKCSQINMKFSYTDRLKPSKFAPNELKDPYYIYFILTSQSVKMRQQLDKYFSLDLKPYYKELLRDHVPMHKWDAWIKHKLQELASLPEQ